MKAIYFSTFFIALLAFSCFANPVELSANHEHSSVNSVPTENSSKIDFFSSVNQLSTKVENIVISFTSPVYFKKLNKLSSGSQKILESLLTFKYRQSCIQIINVVYSCCKSIIIFPFNYFW
jgi:hypothetical protein